MARLSLIIFSAFLTASPVHLIVPLKTPVLSGFEPAAFGPGTYRELVCDASQPDAGTITYKWYKYSTSSGVENWESKGPIGTGPKYTFHPVREKQVFQLGAGNEEPVISMVSGKYKCRASNSAGTRDSEWGDLYVYKPCSKYNVSVSPAKTVIGSTFTLKCYIPNSSGSPVQWTKQSDSSSLVQDVAIADSKGCHAPTNTRYSWSSCSPPSLSSKPKTFNLQVTNAETVESGYWFCKDVGLSCISDPVKLEVQAPPPGTPQIVGFPTGPVAVGAPVKMKCVASPPGDTYDWYKDNTKLTTSLYYDVQVVKENDGVYKCVARNTVGSATSPDKTLIVYYPPTVKLSSNPKPVKEGENLTLTCEAIGGNPASYTYSWYYNSLKQSETSKEYTITGIKYTQSGKYKCEAVSYSPGGKAENFDEIDVLYKAKWNPALRELLTVASETNEPVKFVLHVITNPPPTNVAWSYQNGTKIEKSFTALKVNDTMYTLNKPTVTIKDYGNYTVNVTNQVGVSTFVFELQRAGPPYPPCCLKMINKTAVSVYLTFKSNFSGGSDQTFIIEQSPQGSRRKRSEWVKAAENIPDPGFEKDVFHKVKGLTNKTTYQFRIKAVNADGSSGYNDPGNGNFLKVTTKSAPVADVVVTRKDFIVTVSWYLERKYSKIRIEYCPVKGGGPCLYHDVESPAKQGFINIDVYKEQTYKYSLVVFDGDDKVFSSPPIEPPPPNSALIGGAAAGGFLLLLVIIAVILAVVFIKKRRAEKGEDKRTTVMYDNTSGEGPDGRPDSGQVYMNNGFTVNDSREAEPVYEELQHEQRVPVNDHCEAEPEYLEPLHEQRVPAAVENVEPVYVTDFKETHTVVNDHCEAEPEYLEPLHEQRVPAAVENVEPVYVTDFKEGHTVVNDHCEAEPEYLEPLHEQRVPAAVENVEPVYVTDFKEKHTVVNDQCEAEPGYIELLHEQRVPESVYEEVSPKPSTQTAPKNIDDITVEEFKQWLLSKKVTESTYNVLAENGFNEASIFVLLKRYKDIKGLHIKPLGQEVLVRNLATSFDMFSEGNWSQEAGASSGDGGGRDDMENPYAELNIITPDVIADHVYTDLRPSKK